MVLALAHRTVPSALVYAAAMADKPDQWLGWFESKHTVRKFVLVCVVIAEAPPVPWGSSGARRNCAYGRQ